eukprot:TRINITY_DN774026_c0_g1_i1.p1 TRINITY_DN774026_c0_g1~~TRINITY_DN774026_c0_g1_i1.p1  ORF type:complete len:233 (-),score=32.98 TRINITY_DN774026_c0_g1_i1:235-933(-)
MKTILFFSIVISLALANSCFPVGASDKIEINEKTYVCIEVNGEKRMSFTPTTDDFSRIVVTKSSDWTTSNGFVKDGNDDEYVVFRVCSLNICSGHKIYKNLTTAHTVPVHTAIIHATKGVIDGITFDEGCFFCNGNSNNCIQNSIIKRSDSLIYDLSTDSDHKGCASPDISSDCEDGGCDLQLYVVWTGTDKEDNFLDSAGQRFSLFRKYNVDEISTSIADFGKDNYKRAQS